jgi:hypothetical protein
MSIVIDGVTYAHHGEYFKRYHYKLRIFKNINRETYMEKKNVPCTDCGMRYHPAVMTLDHVDRKNPYRTHNDKRKSPAEMLQYPPETFNKEIEPLEPVCRNCHFLREFIRDGHDKLKRWQEFNNLNLKGAMVVDDGGEVGRKDA